MLDLPNILLSVTALSTTGLSIFVSSRARESKINFYFALFSVFLAFWAIVLIVYSLVDNDAVAIYFMKASYIAALFIGVSFYFFSLLFPDSKEITTREKLLVYIPTVIFAALLLLIPQFLTKSIVHHSWGKETILSWPEYLYFAVLFIYLFVGGLIRIWCKSFTAAGAVRWQLLAIAGSVSTAGALGMYFNLLLPSPFLQNFHYIWSGPLFTSVIAVTITFSIFRFRFFNPRAIFAELLVYTLFLFIFVRLILTETPFDQIVNGILLLAVTVVGYILVKSVTKEVEQREQIEKLSDEKSEFMSFASHEIRNPITAMRGYASLITDGTIGETHGKTLDAAQRIQVIGDQVLALIGEFLNKSKTELGQINYHMSDVDLKTVVSEIADGYAMHAKQKGIELKKDLTPDENLHVKADETKIREIISNLVDNSLKYTRAGSITVGAHRHGVHVRVTISDTGAGISTETMAVLFKKFSRGDAAKSKILGTGIGLYIARTFVEAMGARIWAESEGKDKGSRFIIEFTS